jgi:ATP-dependent metalloprotease
MLVLNMYQLAKALVEHETLNMEEVKKVIKGESIRGIEQIIHDEIARVSSSESEPEPS